jgi:hypothetical protein
MKFKWFIGGDFSYAYFSPAALTSCLGSTWTDFVLASEPEIRGVLGVSAGLGFAQGIAPLKPTDLMLLGQVGIARAFNELAFLRLMVRPGFIGSQTFFSAGLDVSFHLN